MNTGFIAMRRRLGKEAGEGGWGRRLEEMVLPEVAGRLDEVAEQRLRETGTMRMRNVAAWLPLT